MVCICECLYTNFLFTIINSARKDEQFSEQHHIISYQDVDCNFNNDKYILMNSQHCEKMVLTKS